MRPDGEVTAELMLHVRRDQAAIMGEIEALNLQNERLQAAAAENTISGHLRQGIHASSKSLRNLAWQAGVSEDELCEFLEGQRQLPSDVLDRLAQAAGIEVTLSRLQ